MQGSHRSFSVYCEGRRYQQGYTARLGIEGEATEELKTTRFVVTALRVQGAAR